MRGTQHCRSLWHAEMLRRLETGFGRLKHGKFKAPLRVLAAWEENRYGGMNKWKADTASQPGLTLDHCAAQPAMNGGRMAEGRKEGTLRRESRPQSTSQSASDTWLLMTMAVLVWLNAAPGIQGRRDGGKGGGGRRGGREGGREGEKRG